MKAKHILLILLAVVTAIPFAFSQDTQSDEERIAQHYKRKLGNLYFNTNRLNFSGILNTEIKTDKFECYNAWNQPMTLEMGPLPKHITAKLSTEVLQPGGEGYIEITYDATKKNEIGYCADYFSLFTNDPVSPEKKLLTNPLIREDFSILTPEERANAPVIVFDNTEFDFGTIKSGEKVTHKYIFTNKGKSDLIIRKVKSGCGCTTTNPEKTVLKPGESSSLSATFNSARRSGKQRKSITVFCNDPENPMIRLSIGGMVEDASTQ